MKKLLPLPLLILLLCSRVLAAPYGQGAYEFEACGLNCTLIGSWTTVTSGAQTNLNTSTTSGYIEFQVTGRYLLIYRAAANGFGTMTVTVNGSAVIVSNDNGGTTTYMPYIHALPTGTNTVRITANSIFLFLDYFIVLDEAYIPPPTATPSATATPGASPTPAGTPMPETNLVISVQPECRYETLGEEIVAVCRTITGGDIGIIIFLAFVASLLVGIVLVIRWGQRG